MSINVELMINLVENKPIIWDKSLEMYKSKGAKEDAWKEICCMLNDEFEEMEHLDQDDYIKLVIKKWTQVRDSWMKSMKKYTRSRPYIYHNQMSFLEKIMDTPSSANDDSLEPCIIKEEITEDEHIIIEQPETVAATSSISDMRKRKRMDAIEDMGNTKVFKYIDHQLVDSEENRHLSFFKSLLPSLALFDDDQTLEFQGRVIRLLQDIKKTRYSQ
ncbi:uncharacterized protein [Euwallacea fornicatus]|uniref:uncharacterized protein n=1 Tax=Euwallacea fornicatus TaxID=995702 RepID=UPI0033900E17